MGYDVEIELVEAGVEGKGKVPQAKMLPVLQNA